MWKGKGVLCLFVTVLLSITTFATWVYSAQELTVGSYSLVTNKRVNLYEYDYTYRATVTNTGQAVTNATASAVNTSTYLKIIDGNLSFGSVPANSTVTSSDTFTVRHDRRGPFETAKLVWIVNATPAMVTVPAVTGQIQAGAQSTLQTAGLILGDVSTSYSDTVPTGSVISQTPSAGASVVPGTAVALVVSMGPAPVTVPSVVGMLPADAKYVITSAKLTEGPITQAYSGTVPSGTVISQVPQAGTSVAQGTAVAIVLSLGPERVIVPNFVGMPQTAALTAIVTAKLAEGSISQSVSNSVPSGIVISQTPPAGTAVAPGTAVALVISIGPPPVTVPNVVGMGQAMAQSSLQAASLAVGTITQESNPTVPAGSVISQDPLAGSSVLVGSSVNLVVSSLGIAQFSLGTDFPIASQTIPATGGMIAVSGTGSPLDGVIVVIPEGTLPDNTLVTVGYNNGTLTPASGIFPGIIISLNVANVKTFEKPISITVPFTGNNMVPVPYYIDSNGKLHLAQIVSIDRIAGNFTFHTFHASLYTFVMGSLNDVIGKSAITNFSPENDGFKIINNDSIYNRGGECAGMTSFSLWYFENYKSILGNLFNRYDGGYCCQDLGTDYDGNSITGENCIATRSFISYTRDWSYYWPLLELEENLPTDRDRFNSICNNIINSQYPVMLYLYNESRAHSVLAYGFEATDPHYGTIFVYDPNYPASSHVINFDFSTNSFNAYDGYDGIIYIGDGSYTWEPYQDILDDAQASFHSSKGAVITLTSPTSRSTVSTPMGNLVGHIESGQVLVTDLDVFVGSKKYSGSVSLDGSFSISVSLACGVNHLYFSPNGVGADNKHFYDLPSNLEKVDYTITRDCPSTSFVIGFKQSLKSSYSVDCTQHAASSYSANLSCYYTPGLDNSAGFATVSFEETYNSKNDIHCLGRCGGSFGQTIVELPTRQIDMTFATSGCSRGSTEFALNPVVIPPMAPDGSSPKAFVHGYDAANWCYAPSYYNPFSYVIYPFPASNYVNGGPWRLTRTGQYSWGCPCYDVASGGLEDQTVDISVYMFP